jgi:hypothetical protein
MNVIRNQSQAFQFKFFSLESLGFICSLLFFSSCASTPPLEQWVQDRGYQFHKDYSSLNSLGWLEEKKGHLTKNPSIAITEEEIGDIPDFENNQNLAFKIEGKVQVQKFLNAFGGAKLEGAIEKIKNAEISLHNPHIKIARTMVPMGLCKKNKMLAATKILNTGAMSMRIKDSLDHNITGVFDIKTTEGSAGTWMKNSDELTLIGEGYNVGYVTQKVECFPKGKPEEFELIKGKSSQVGGVYFYYRKFSDGSKSTESLPIATMYIAPSAFMAKMGRIDQIFTASAQISGIIAEDTFNPDSAVGFSCGRLAATIVLL